MKIKIKICHLSDYYNISIISCTCIYLPCPWTFVYDIIVILSKTKETDKFLHFVYCWKSLCAFSPLRIVLWSMFFHYCQHTSHPGDRVISKAGLWRDICAGCVLQCRRGHCGHVCCCPTGATILSHWHSPEHGHDSQHCHTLWCGPWDNTVLEGRLGSIT